MIYEDLISLSNTIVNSNNQILENQKEITEITHSIDICMLHIE